ncbi:DUF943 family protein [Kosakonia oryziphila]|jgi:Enterobacterial putative membrane protein (DUF943).|uniref:Putative membrane protein n=1 Tax=Kosakonia oryziphila TaxID=1005667 RepID=A0A1C4D8C2_9ENTR|nr:DUF943 family protein [Kosakonia oryziphila]SCC27579.1 putative membrane protein [Kosakonia oryziphila]
MRKLVFFSLIVVLCIIGYLFTEKSNVSVIGAHYDGSTAQVIVNKLPLTDSDKINWWKKKPKQNP